MLLFDSLCGDFCPQLTIYAKLLLQIRSLPRCNLTHEHQGRRTSQGCVTDRAIPCNANVQTGDKIASCHSRKKYEVMDLGIMHPEETPTTCLRPGQVGWVGGFCPASVQCTAMLTVF